ncbi:calponin-like actin-binding domain-containing [Trichoderma cornu-damae]|uniref:Calponin-like actin-binding domain-containing n=1 Tax=Trichoderma cornu-damae TaxID=654480 RepID=A0A9P8QVB0_9HYPO|nr:calponin-like actin-binding domain-containing [Trichoderma cornu-damae]
MASVTSLDKDLRKLRLEKYTPAAANEARAWIEEILGEPLPSKDLLEGLKDGVALCRYAMRPAPVAGPSRLVNLAVPAPGVKFKKSAMPFVQMENISHFLRACQAPPLNLHQHDTFLTVDLFEQKDPAQVLQCIGAFSRAANAANPQDFPHAIGPKTAKPGVVTPQGTGTGTGAAGSRGRGASFTGDSLSARLSPGKAPGSPESVSTWSKKEHEGSTAPAWNIAQYGYLGGASQGNLGIAFGARRQITSTTPQVPSLVEKERIRREKVAEEERQRQDDQARRQAQLDAENRARAEEEKRWELETERQREEERRRVLEEKQRWEEQERQWKLTEDKRRREEAEAEARVEEERRRARNRSPAKLHGQYLSQYQAEQASADRAEAQEIAQRERIREARQREAEYERGRQERAADGEVPDSPARPREPRSPGAGNASQLNRHESWSQGGREVLQTKWKQHQEDLEEDEREDLAPAPPLANPPRPLPNPNAPPGGRPLPDPAKYSSPPREAPQNRTDRFLATNPAPMPPVAQQTYARELGATEERDAEDQRRIQGQDKTKAGGWASKSLLEREKEMERLRQKEWEEAQKETAAMSRNGNGVDGIGGGIDGRWDVSQWSGYTGGDGQNRGSQGIGAGRRQIVGPRPLPNGGR